MAEGARLERVCRETYRGFESLSHRHFYSYMDFLFGYILVVEMMVVAQ